MKKSKSISALLITHCIITSAAAQGTFQNLNFESAILTPIPAGQYGGMVSINNALPGWTGYIGTNQIAQVLQNNATLGNPSIDILGPLGGALGLPNPIEGQYTAVLQAGVGAFGRLSASIAQTGLVPSNAQSLQFMSGSTTTIDQFTISLAGQPIIMVSLFNSGTYTLFGGDISVFAGQNAELRITAGPTGGSFVAVDSILFSSQVVPEPSSIGLVAIGCLLLGWRHCSGGQQIWKILRK